MRKVLPLCTAVALALLAYVVVVEARVFTALCGTGASCAYVSGDPVGYQTFNRIRTNFNDHESRIVTLEAAGGGDVTASSVATFTNKTYAVAATGNVFTSTFQEWFPAAICQNTTASTAWSLPASSPAVAACVTGTNTQYGVLDFANGSNLTAQFHYKLPTDWTTGGWSLVVTWFTSATTGDVLWEAQKACVGDGVTGDPTLDDGDEEVVDTAKGTTLQHNLATIVLGTDVSQGCSSPANKTLFIRLRRNSGDAFDTLAATARLVGVQLNYTRVQ